MRESKYKIGDTLVLVEDVEIDEYVPSKAGEYFKVVKTRFSQVFNEWVYQPNDIDKRFYFTESEVRECTKMDEVLGNEISSDRIQERE
jgi:hypothetical protein